MAGITFRYWVRISAICFHFILIGIMFRMLLENERTTGNVELGNTEPQKKSSAPKELPPTNRTERFRLLGPGEDGKAVLVPSDIGELLQKEIDASIAQYGFNDVINRMVSVYRIISDEVLPPECKTIKYPDNLPEVSIVIPFRDESWFILLRTVHSLLGNSPRKLLKEIILVDDGSTGSNLKMKLDIYVSNLPNVKVIHLPKPMGLMVARQTGIEATSADHFIVMDSHMEVIKGWLEPLMARLAENPKTLVHSRMGAINSNDFSFNIASIEDVGRFTGIDFFLEPRPFLYSNDAFNSRKRLTDPIRVPLIAGMIIGMNKHYFLKLGGFDTGMKIWGSEQVELSIKVWMCGGVLEEIPCSCAAHMYRAASVWTIDAKTLIQNKLRVADVWMDQYADIVHEMVCNYTEATSDVEDRKRIRKANNCTNFDSYLEIIKNMSAVYVPLRRRAKGRITNVMNEKCVDKPWQGNMIVYPCHTSSNQFFEWSDEMEIRNGVDCLVASLNNTLSCDLCNKYPLDKRQWNYKYDRSLFNRETGHCLSAADDATLKLEICDGSSRQQWHWQRLR